MTFAQTLWEHKMANVTAAGLTSTPLWLQYLEGVSEVAAVLLPILGVTWFAVQIYYHIKYRGKR